MAAIIAGLIWHFGRYRRKEKKTEMALENLSKFFFQYFGYSSSMHTSFPRLLNKKNPVK